MSLCRDFWVDGGLVGEGIGEKGRRRDGGRREKKALALGLFFIALGLGGGCLFRLHFFLVAFSLGI